MNTSDYADHSNQQNEGQGGSGSLSNSNGPNTTGQSSQQISSGHTLKPLQESELHELGNNLKTIPDEVIAKIFNLAPQSDVSRFLNSTSAEPLKDRLSPVLNKSLIMKTKLDHAFFKAALNPKFGETADIYRTLLFPTKTEEGSHLNATHVTAHPYLRPGELIELLSRCKELTSLHLSGYDPTKYEPPMSHDELLTRIVALRPKLQIINLAGSEITDIGLEAVANHCKDIEHLNLHNCSWVSDVGVTRLAGECTGLKTLILSGCKKITDASLETLASSCKQLVSLNLALCNRITGRGVIALAGLGKTLTNLNLERPPGKDGPNRDVSDQAIIELTRNCKALVSINLSGRCVVDEVLHNLAGCRSLTSLYLAQCGLGESRDVYACQIIATVCPRLETLDLSRNDRLGTSSINSIANGCKSLKTFSLSGVRLQSAQGFRSLVDGCNELQTLNLIGCSLDDRDLKAIANGSTKLENLDIKVAFNVTDGGIDALITGCRALSKIDISFCGNVTQKKIDELRQRGIEVVNRRTIG